MKDTIQETVKSLCKYFDWEENSEQAHEITSALTKAKQSGLDEIGEIISKYQGAEEIETNGRRYLKLTNREEVPFGYPYPDTKEKYIVREILQALSPKQ